MSFLQPAALISSGADILFPPRCSVCGSKLFRSGEKKICGNCSSAIVYLRQPLCAVCGTELAGAGDDQNHLCGNCLRKPPPFLLARSVVRYSEPVQKLIHGLKYGGDTSVLPGIAEILSNFDMVGFTRCNCVIPVPLHPKKLRQRGLNQSILLARLIVGRDIIPDLQVNLLKRIRDTVSQTKLDGKERRKNLKDAFAMGGKVDLRGMVICLVDDVYTTGTTVSECSAVLRKNGAREVRVLTLARVAQPHCSAL